MHDALYRSENDIKCVVHDDLGWKNQTTMYSAASLALRVIYLSFMLGNFFGSFTEPFIYGFYPFLCCFRRCPFRVVAFRVRGF